VGFAGLFKKRGSKFAQQRCEKTARVLSKKEDLCYDKWALKGFPCFCILKFKTTFWFAPLGNAPAVFGWKNLLETVRAQEDIL
jgi:hypothetical protein